MTVVNVPIKDIRPYDKNTKKHTGEQVANIALSIEKYGFVQPIVLDAGNYIVIGHGRYAAMKRLKKTDVPCVYVENLTPQQIAELRILDNKLNESEWDMDLLAEELPDLDFEDFSLDFGFPDDDEPKRNERMRTDDAYKLPYVDIERTEGFYQMPTIRATQHIPDGLMGFNYALTSHDTDKGIHFYIDDYQFERVWNDPEKYFKVLQDYDCMLTPDFSLYLDMPMSMKIWNVFRSRLIGQMAQDAGLEVIPTVSWAEPNTFAFAFDGIAEYSVVSVSTVGVKNDPNAMAIWRQGMTELIKRKKPSAVLVYGGEVDFDYGDTKVYYFANAVTERMKVKKDAET